MRNLVKTAAAVAVAMAISTAANAVDTQSKSNLSNQNYTVQSSNSLDELLKNVAVNNANMVKNSKAITDTKAQITKLNDDLNKLPATSELVNKLADATDATMAQKRVVDNLTKSVTEKNKYLSDVNKTLKDLNDAINGDNPELKAQAKAALSGYQNAQKVTQEQLGKLEPKLASAQKTYQSLKEAQDIAEKNHSTKVQLTGDLARAKNELDTLKNTQKQLEDKNKDLRMQELNSGAFANKKELEKVSNTVDAVHDKVVTLDKRVKTNESLTDEHFDKNDQHLQKIDGRLDGVDSNLAKVNKELGKKANESTVKAVEAKLEATKADKSALKAFADKVEDTKANKSTVKAVEAKLEATKADKSALKAFADKVEDTKANKSTVKAVEEKLEATKADKSALKAFADKVEDTKANKSTVKAVEEKLEATKADKSALKAFADKVEDTKANKSTVKAVEEKLEATKADKSALKAFADKIEATKANKSKVEAVENKFDTAVKNVNDRVTGETAARVTADKSIKESVVRNKAAQEKVNNQYKLVLDGHEVKITENAQRIDIQGKKFDQKLKDHDARITHNAVGVKELQAAIFEGNGELAKAAHQVAAEKEKLEAMKAQAKEKGTKGATLAVAKPSANDIKAQQAKYDAAVANMHDLSPVSRKEMKENIINLAMATQNVNQALQANIDANKAAIKANKDAIAHNAQAIESNSRRIHNLDKREQRHMAQNAALAGLFQPYSIGRLNVTAAMGQYRSNNAIAVGAGYRFDNNLAVKAGFSMSTNAADDAAYNVGVNYEF